MIQRLVIAVLAGFFGHFATRPTDKLLPAPRLNRLARYGAGCVLILIVNSIFNYRHMDKIYRDRSAISLVFSMFGVGLGVGLGNVWDALHKGV